MWDKPGTSAIGTLQPTKKRNTSLAREKRKRLSKTLNIVLGGGKKGRKQKDKSSDIFFNQPVFNLPLLLRSHMAFCLQGSSYNLRRAVFLPQLSTGVGFCSNNKREENPNWEILYFFHVLQNKEIATVFRPQLGTAVKINLCFFIMTNLCL